MEKDIKQHSIAYNKGITNQPSHILADDGELSACNGLTFENGELKPIQDPASISGVPNKKILCVHGGRYLYHNESNNGIYYYSGNSSGLVMSIGGLLVDITTVGNSVIATSTTGTYYAIWEGVSYTYLGNKIPEPEVELRMAELSSRRDHVGSYEDWVDSANSKVYYEHQNDFDNLVWGTLRRLVRGGNEDTLFVYPFVARVALELYDGSYILHSAPQIMLPWYGADGLYLFKVDDWNSRGDIHVPVHQLMYRINNEGTSSYDKWKDIVKNITIFISRPVNPFLETAVYENKTNAYLSQNISCGYMLALNSESSSSTVKNIGTGYRYFFDFETEGRPGAWSEVRLILKAKSNATIIGELKEESTFFKLCDIGLTPTYGGGYRTTQGMFSETTITNIETHQQLPNEDFHTHDSYCYGNLYAYNGRLHMFGAKRILFDGFKNFFAWSASSSYNYTIYVKINTNEGDRWVKVSTGTTDECIGAFYFYYPDSRAKEARIFVNGYLRKTLPLTEHPGLNGAYWIDSSLPTSTYASLPSSQGGSEPLVKDTEMLNNVLLVSEADNPFLFLPKGQIAVGDQQIVGIAAVTMALNEYQHGHTPLVAFCTDGIFSLSLNAEGYYSSIQAVSREVCNNPSSITQVDNGIFFASEKGLMYIDTAGVKCVSPQMKGTDFDTFIDNCLIAYDYRDSLLYIYSTQNSDFHYIYNMKTGTFSTRDGSCDNVVNNYPDTIIQMLSGSTWNTYSLINKPDEQADPTTYTGSIKTRPMKFSNILTLKSIRHIRHLYAMNPNATVVLTVEASNDAVNWTTLTSLRGKPWKLYRFRIQMNNLRATDRYAGTVVWTQERRTEKPR